MSSPPLSLRLLSYNMHKGFALGNRRLVLGRMRDAIREIQADVVFLQEVVGENQRHARVHSAWQDSQYEYLADEVWQHYAYGKNAVYDHGHHGNAILSKYPIVEWSNFNISTNRVEQRGMLAAKVFIPPLNLHLHCLCVHLGLTRRGRARQLEYICEKIAPLALQDEPLILAGDFNDWRSQASKILKERLQIEEAFKIRHGKYAKTFPSRFPLIPLDRVYSRGLEVIEAQTLATPPWSQLSDHAALQVTFQTRV